MSSSNSKFLLFLLTCNIIVSIAAAAGPDVHRPVEVEVKSTDEAAAAVFLNTIDAQANELCRVSKLNQWKYHTNLSSTAARSNATNSNLAYWAFWKNASDQSAKFDSGGFANERSQRLLHLIGIYGQIVTGGMKKFTEAKQAMESIFSKAKVCSYKERWKCGLALEPDLTMEMTNTKDPDQLLYYWLAFRNATGRKMRGNYTEMASIMHEAITASGHYKTVMAAETRSYETPSLQEDVDGLWEQLAPFYAQLHAYVRSKLQQHYSSKWVSSTGPIPAHLLGNMWAQSWSNIFDLVVPFPGKASLDITPKMIQLQLTPRKMAEMAQTFFESLGFPPLPAEFWSGSILEKPVDREIICHASAWDMCDGQNYWIKQCTRVTFEDFITLHHEMGHIYYQLAYRSEPLLFREGANQGFHEAIGDLISLSVQTPGHLRTVGLLEENGDDADDLDDDEAHLNYLMSMALENVAFLPFAYLVDQWRWGVFQGDIGPEDYNCGWWRLRVEVQGIAPPVTRSEHDFDPGAKFHVASNTGYIRYFVSSIIQFQFHQALCTLAGKYDPATKSPPLHKCDIHGSKEAGERLMQMLSMGYSRPWQDAMQVMTGKRHMDASPILDYFHPLIKWLEKENRRLNATIGWKQEDEKPYCVKVKATTKSNSAEDKNSASQRLQQFQKSSMILPLTLLTILFSSCNMSKRLLF